MISEITVGIVLRVRIPGVLCLAVVRLFCTFDLETTVDDPIWGHVLGRV